MIGGGTWKKQNKILHGAYINFVGKRTGGVRKPIVDPAPDVPDVPDAPDIPDTMSVLGVAKLGQMILA